jgi:WXG100 family type VII secretion target
MANINMTYQEIDQQAMRVDGGRDEIQSTLDKLMSEVQALTASGFVTDQASGAFGDSYQQFTTGAKQCIDGLTGMSSFLRQTSQQMAALDQQLAAGIRM